MPLFILIFLLFSNVTVFAAPRNETVLQYRYFNKNTGFNSSQVSSVAFDKQGRTWLATNSGLIMFNGEQFKNMELHKKIPEVSQQCKKVYTDKKGRIWFINYPSGWGYLDPATGQIVNFAMQCNLSIPFINCIYQSNSGEIWIGAFLANSPKLSGLFLLDEKTKHLKQFLFEPQRSLSHREIINNITGICEDKTGNLWLSSLNGVVKFHQKTNKHTILANKDAYNSYLSIRNYNDSLILVGTWGKGILTINLKTNQTKTYPINPLKKWSGTQNIVPDILPYKPNQFLVASYDKGLFVFNIETGTYSYPVNADGKAVSDFAMSLECLGQNAQGQVVCGTAEMGFYVLEDKCRLQQLYKIDPVPNYLHGLSEVYETEKKDELLVLSSYGMYSYLLNTQTGKSKKIKALSGDESIVYHFAWPLGSNQFYVNTDYGGYIFDLNTTKVYGKETLPPILAEYRPMCRTYGNKEFLWVYKNGCIVQYNKALKEVFRYCLPPNITKLFPDYFWFEIIQNKVFYIGNLNGDFLELDMLSGKYRLAKFSGGVSLKNVISIKKDLLLECDFNGLHWIHLDKDSIWWEPADFHQELAVTKYNHMFSINDSVLLISSESGYILYNHYANKVVENEFPGGKPYFYISWLNQRNQLCFANAERVILEDFNLQHWPYQLAVSNIEVNNIQVYNGLGELPQTLSLESDQRNLSITMNVNGLLLPKLKYFFYLVQDKDTFFTDQNSNRAIFNNLPPGHYRFVAVAQFSGQNTQIIAEPLYIQIAKPWYNTWLFYVCVFLTIVALVILGVRMRIKQVRRVATINSRITEANLKALRSQMNPHFIFNSLNSINRFILKSNPETASDYLTKFAKLIRLILDNSAYDFIPLQKELDSLSLYIELERLRVAKPIAWEVNLNGLDSEDIQIQPLLLQPFIENAIWHGIVAPDVSNGVIQLSVKIIEGRVHYFIEDNGIGRRKSVVENSTLHSGSRSIGIELTMNRLKMADPSAAIQIIDKENDTGTIVHINHILKV